MDSRSESHLDSSIPYASTQTPVSQFFNLTGKTFRQIAAPHEPAAPTFAMATANEEVGGLGPLYSTSGSLGDF